MGKKHIAIALALFILLGSITLASAASDKSSGKSGISNKVPQNYSNIPFGIYDTGVDKVYAGFYNDYAYLNGIYYTNTAHTLGWVPIDPNSASKTETFSVLEYALLTKTKLYVLIYNNHIQAAETI